MRAKALGLSFLRHAKANDIDTSPVEFNRRYRTFIREVKTQEAPIIEVVTETPTPTPVVPE